jgi:hypothetical protein
MFDNGNLTTPALEWLCGGTSNFAKTGMVSKDDARKFLGLYWTENGVGSFEAERDKATMRTNYQQNTASVTLEAGSITLKATNDITNRSGLLAVDSTGKAFVFSGVETSGKFNPDRECYRLTAALNLTIIGTYTRQMTSNDIGRTYKFWSGANGNAVYTLDYPNKGATSNGTGMTNTPVGCDGLVFLTCIDVMSDGRGKFLVIRN